MVKKACIKGLKVVRRCRTIVNLREVGTPEPSIFGLCELSRSRINAQENTYKRLIYYRIKERTGIPQDRDTAKMRSAPGIGVPQEENKGRDKPRYRRR
jgi:hypothetical protein